MLAYPITLTPDDNGTTLVGCPLLPMVMTFGENEAEARRHGVDAIETALGAMRADGDEIPVPAEDNSAVRLPLLTSLKVQLYWSLRGRSAERST